MSTLPGTGKTCFMFHHFIFHHWTLLVSFLQNILMTPKMETYFASCTASKEKSPPYIKRASLLTDQLSLLSQSYYQDNWAAPVSVSLERGGKYISNPERVKGRKLGHSMTRVEK